MGKEMEKLNYLKYRVRRENRGRRINRARGIYRLRREKVKNKRQEYLKHGILSFL